MQLTPGDTVADGKYRIVRLIGRGGMGAVYEAEHGKTGRRVAIKCVRAERAGDPVALQRIRREARMVGALEHPNVVGMLDVHEDEHSVLLIMEYLEGKTLRAALEAERLPIHQFISLLLPAIRGVASAHRKGYLHRDIKPDNIFLARLPDHEELVPKVLDFGIGRPTADATLLTEGPIGTPLYMSLEQLQGQSDVDARTDVYAFGVVLYEGLTGTRPYEASNYFEYCATLTHTEPTAPKALRADIPWSLSRLVLWALEKNREQRVPSLEHLARELEPFRTARGVQREAEHSMPLATAATLPVQPTAATAEPSDSGPKSTLRPIALTPARVAPAARSKRGGVLFAIAAVLVALGLAVFMRSDNRPSVPERAPSPAAPPQDVPAPTEAATPAAATPTAATPIVTPPTPTSTPQATPSAEPPAARPPEKKPEQRANKKPAEPVVDAELERLQRELLQCSELSASVRELCRTNYRKEIAERKRDVAVAGN
jgi:serine/threonine protein kinase